MKQAWCCFSAAVIAAAVADEALCEQNDTSGLLQIGARAKAPCKNTTAPACKDKKVLLLTSGVTSSGSNKAYVWGLEDLGFDVTGPLHAPEYAGEPSASEFDLVLLSYGTNVDRQMPKKGQESISSAHINEKVGVITTDHFTAYGCTYENTGFGLGQEFYVQWAESAHLCLFRLASHSNGLSTNDTLCENTVGFCNMQHIHDHPILSGIPDNLHTSMNVSYSFGPPVLNITGHVIMSWEYLNTPAVVVQDDGVEGRTVQYNFAPEFADWWWNSDLLRLMQNIAGWTASCPDDASFLDTTNEGKRQPPSYPCDGEVCLDLGYSVDVNNVNLFDSASVRDGAKDGAVKTLDPSCFIMNPTARSTRVSNEFKKSLSDWARSYQAGLGIKLSGGFFGVKVTVDISHEASFKFQNTRNIQTFEHVRENIAATARLSQLCYEDFDSDVLSDRFLTAIQRVPIDLDGTPSSLDNWVSFIRRYGSAIVTSVSFGTAVRLNYANVGEREDSDDYLHNKFCLGLEWSGESASAGVEFCAQNTKTNNKSEEYIEIQGPNCQTQGCPGGAADACTNGGVIDEDRWATCNAGGVLEDIPQAIQHKFYPISDVLRNLEYYDEASMMDLATAYQSCEFPWTWEEAKHDGTGNRFQGPGCYCRMECQNGGKLDPLSCTCECQQNVAHGWYGPDCSEEFGKCQPGLETGNPEVAYKCPLTGNCGDEACSKSEVCCANNFNDVCCPFGSICDSPLTGRVSCICPDWFTGDCPTSDR